MQMQYSGKTSNRVHWLWIVLDYVLYEYWIKKSNLSRHGNKDLYKFMSKPKGLHIQRRLKPLLSVSSCDLLAHPSLWMEDEMGRGKDVRNVLGWGLESIWGTWDVWEDTIYKITLDCLCKYMITCTCIWQTNKNVHKMFTNSKCIKCSVCRSSTMEQTYMCI